MQPAAPTILLYYHYADRPLDAAAECSWHTTLIERLALGGRLRVATQGLNGVLSGSMAALEEYTRHVGARLEGARIDWKFSAARPHELFSELRARVVDEVVSLGVQPELAPLEAAGRHVSPAEFHALLDRATAGAEAGTLAAVAWNSAVATSTLSARTSASWLGSYRPYFASSCCSHSAFARSYASRMIADERGESRPPVSSMSS